MRRVGERETTVTQGVGLDHLGGHGKVLHALLNDLYTRFHVK